MKDPITKMLSKAAWKLVSKANNTTKDDAPDNVWELINSSNSRV